MSRITAAYDFERIAPEDVPKYVAIFAEDVAQRVNGNLDFQTNFSCKLHSATFSAANVDVALQHGLNRAPTGYIVYSRSAAMIVYDGATAWSASTIYLRASAIGTARVIVF